MGFGVSFGASALPRQTDPGLSVLGSVLLYCWHHVGVLPVKRLSIVDAEAQQVCHSLGITLVGAGTDTIHNGVYRNHSLQDRSPILLATWTRNIAWNIAKLTNVNIHLFYLF